MEKFFFTNIQIEDISIIEEFILRRFNSIDYIMQLNYYDGLNIIIQGFRKEREEKLYQQYVVLYPLMDEKNFISFEEFLDKFSIENKQETQHSKEETRKKVKEIIDMAIKEAG